MTRAISNFETVIPPSFDFKPKRIIAVPIDDESSSSNHTINFILKNVTNPETDEIHLINVRQFEDGETNIWSIESRFPAFHDRMDERDLDYFDPETASALEKISKTRSKNILLQAAKQFQNHGFHVSAVSLVGDTRQELVDHFSAYKPKLDLAVLGKRGLGTFTKLVLGSTSDYCIKHSPIPVMIVPLP